MNGHVDSAGRALVRLRLTSAATATTMEIEAWIDTGFTGELVLPQDQIAALGLPHSAVVTAELGDGSANGARGIFLPNRVVWTRTTN